MNYGVGKPLISESCKQHITWAFNIGKKYLEVDQYYPQMIDVTGVSPKDATFEDFQREFKCRNLHIVDCKKQLLQFPLTCSFPPCNRCKVDIVGKPSRERKS